MIDEGRKPSAATVFDPSLTISSIDRKVRVMYCPDEQAMGWFITERCPQHPDAQMRIINAAGWQCLECGQYLGAWHFTRARFEDALHHVVQAPEAILFNPVQLNAWIKTVRCRELEASGPRAARAAALKRWIDQGCKGPPPVQPAPAWPVDNPSVPGPLSDSSTTAGDRDRGVRQFFGLKVLHHRWRRALEFMGFRR